MILVERHHKRTQHGRKKGCESLPDFLFQRRKRTAACFLHALVVVQYHRQQALEHWHEVLLLMLDGFTRTPVRVAAQCPTRDRSHERLRILQCIDKQRHKRRQMRRHAIDASLSHSAQRQDPRLALEPVVAKQTIFE